MKETKARRLLKVAFATYRKGTKDPQVRKLAKDIFCLAMDDPSARQEFGAPSKGELEAQLTDAVASGDFDAASGIMESLQALKGAQAQDEDMPPMDEGMEEEEEYEEEMEDEDLGEGALSPGDEVPPPPIPELAPAQVAKLVTLARKVNRGGHPDLAKKITRQLGLP
jgi:hypothetical protein